MATWAKPMNVHEQSHQSAMKVVSKHPKCGGHLLRKRNLHRRAAQEEYR